MGWIWSFVVIFNCIGAVFAYVGDYIGCFMYRPTDITNYQIQWAFVERILLETNNCRLCIELCHPYFQYAGIEGKYCYCLNSLIGKKVSETLCNTTCPNQHSSYKKLCGGKLKMSVYELNLFAGTILTEPPDQILNQSVTNITTTTSKSAQRVCQDREQNDDSEITVADTNYLTASNATTEVSPMSGVENNVTEISVTDRDFMSVSSVTNGTNAKITLTPSIVTSKQTAHSVDTNSIILIFAIGTFVVVSLFATVKLILIVRKIRSNMDRNTSEEDGIYLRPVYITTQNDQVERKSDHVTAENPSDLYEEIESNS